LLFIELDENTIAAQAFGFFAAGYETSSNTIAFCLYELALNQEIQDKTRREVHNAIGTRDGKLTYDAVQEMKYLDMVILGTNPLVSLMKNPKIKNFFGCNHFIVNNAEIRFSLIYDKIIMTQ